MQHPADSEREGRECHRVGRKRGKLQRPHWSTLPSCTLPPSTPIAQTRLIPPSRLTPSAVLSVPASYPRSAGDLAASTRARHRALGCAARVAPSWTLRHGVHPPRPPTG